MNTQSTQENEQCASLRCGDMVRRMDPDRFTIGERVQYVNHVTGDELGLLEVVGLEGGFVLCNRFFTRTDPFKFHRDGRATWSSNLSIRHEPNIASETRGAGADTQSGNRPRCL